MAVLGFANKNRTIDAIPLADTINKVILRDWIKQYII